MAEHQTTWHLVPDDTSPWPGRYWESRHHRALVAPTADTRVAPNWPPVRTVMVWRKDEQPLGAEHFGVLMSVKNAIFGRQYTAVEVYPPADQVRDRANVYWLQVFDDPTYDLPWLRKQRGSVLPDLSPIPADEIGNPEPKR